MKYALPLLALATENITYSDAPSTFEPEPFKKAPVKFATRWLDVPTGPDFLPDVLRDTLPTPIDVSPCR